MSESEQVMSNDVDICVVTQGDVSPMDIAEALNAKSELTNNLIQQGQTYGEFFRVTPSNGIIRVYINLNCYKENEK